MINDTETDIMICSLNQLSGFYMIEALALNRWVHQQPSRHLAVQLIMEKLEQGGKYVKS